MTNINDLIKEVLLFVKSEALKSNIKIIRYMDESLPKVLVQPIQIEQVLLNLLKNSIESLQMSHIENKHLIIKTELAGGNALVVTVEDNGPGINKALKEDVFDPFITNKNDGLGLGLSISQGIIEAHHGKLYLHASYVSDLYSEGQTVFRFALPVLSEVAVINNNVSLKNLVR
jgi:two-component system sensor histidine kinase TtrS